MGSNPIRVTNLCFKSLFCKVIVLLEVGDVMKKKVLLLLLGVFLLTACASKDAKLFKKNYEGLNGLTNVNGQENRVVSIPKDNPITISTAKEIVNKIENEETFYVYFGSTLCPWCRSVIEKALEVANNNGIKKVYYVDVWDDEGNEILRDKYTLDDDGKAVLVEEGTAEYFKLLEYLDEVLPNYTYAANKNGGSKLDIEEKRIYLPLFVYIAKGKPIRVTTGISDSQTSSREELTAEMLADEEKMFDDFFINVCDESC